MLHNSELALKATDTVASAFKLYTAITNAKLTTSSFDFLPFKSMTAAVLPPLSTFLLDVSHLVEDVFEIVGVLEALAERFPELLDISYSIRDTVETINHALEYSQQLHSDIKAFGTLSTVLAQLPKSDEIFAVVDHSGDDDILEHLPRVVHTANTMIGSLTHFKSYLSLLKSYCDPNSIKVGRHDLSELKEEVERARSMAKDLQYELRIVAKLLDKKRKNIIGL